MSLYDKKIKTILFIATGALISLGSGAAWAAEMATQATAPSVHQANTPQQVVANLNTALILAMKTGPSGTYQQRFHIVYPAVRSAFNIPMIGQLTLGTSWNDLNASQRQQFVETLTKYSAANYAAHFDHYAGQKFTLSPPQMVAGGRAIITSDLIAKNGMKNQFAYILSKSEGQWQILNVSTDGVSDMAMEKAEFTEALQKVGFKTLIAQLKAHTADLARGHA